MRALLVVLPVSLLVACAGSAVPPSSAHEESSSSSRTDLAAPSAPVDDATGPVAAPPPASAIVWDSKLVLGTHGKRVCSGRAPKEAPHTAACCYPARDAVLAPIRAIHPSFRACYDALPAPRQETSVAVRFHVGADGHVDEACADEAYDVPAALTRCVLETMREARYPATSADESKLCGLLSVTYPVRFSP